MASNWRGREAPMDFTWDKAPVDPSSPFIQKIFPMKKRPHDQDQQQDRKQSDNNQSELSSKSSIFTFGSSSSSSKHIGKASSTSTDKASSTYTDKTSMPPSSTSSSSPSTSKIFDFSSAPLFNPGSDVQSVLHPTSSSNVTTMPNKKRNIQNYNHNQNQNQNRRRRRGSSLSSGDENNKYDRNDSSSSSFDDQHTLHSTTSSGILNFLRQHNDLPQIISGYVLLFVSLSLVGGLLYTVYSVARMLNIDVNQKMEERSAEVLLEMAACSKEYLENRCAPHERVPAMEKTCLAWEKCMNKDPQVIGRSRVSAETIAEIFNSFFDVISYKALAVGLASLAWALLLANLSFSLIRTRSNESYQPLRQQLYHYENKPYRRQIRYR